MSLTVFAIVLFAAALHAVWNAIVKGGDDTLLTTILIAGSGALIAICALPFLPPVAPQSWPYLAVSAVLEITYYALVARAYRDSDMSKIYPLMRGTAPLLVVAVSTLALGVSLSLPAWLGVSLVSAGLLSLTFSSRGGADTRGTLFALANAAVIASYTLVDGMGVRVSGAPAAYTMWVYVLTGVPLLLWALMRRRDILAYAARNWHLGLIGGIGTMASYGLVLWAMTEAPVPVIAALRETSILFGTAIAAFVLRERIGVVRIVAVLVIALGAAALRFA